MIDEQSSHQTCNYGEEVRTIFPRHVCANEANVRFVDQCGGLQRMLRTLVPHVVPGEASQIAVNQRHQLIERVLVAVAPIAKQTGYVARARGGLRFYGKHALKGKPARLGGL